MDCENLMLHKRIDFDKRLDAEQQDGHLIVKKN